MRCLARPDFSFRWGKLAGNGICDSVVLARRPKGVVPARTGLELWWCDPPADQDTSLSTQTKGRAWNISNVPELGYPACLLVLVFAFVLVFVFVLMFVLTVVLVSVGH